MRGFLRALAFALVAAQSSVAAAETLPPFRLIELGGSTMKWGNPIMGAGATVTYAFVEAPVSIPDARNCGAMVPMTGLLAKAGVEQKTFEAEVANAFKAWSSVANLRFSKAASPAEADILIGAQAVPKGRAFTNVEFEETGAGKVRSLEKSLICLNPEQPWKIGFDGDLDVYDLRYSMAHEIGHAIGLDHPSASGQVMSYKYEERVDTLQIGDIHGAVALYGHGKQLASGQPGVVSVGAPGRAEKAKAVAERRHQTRALP
jgi:hypothetical protein